MKQKLAQLDQKLREHFFYCGFSSIKLITKKLVKGFQQLIAQLIVK